MGSCDQSRVKMEKEREYSPQVIKEKNMTAILDGDHQWKHLQISIRL